MQSNKRVVIYGADWCGYCQNAKKFFTNLDAEFDFINTDENPQKLEDLLKAHNWKSIPMIFIDGKFEGGFSDVSEKFR